MERKGNVLINRLMCVCDQARAIRKNDWLSELELEAIKRQIDDECQGKLCREQDVPVEAETVEMLREEMNDAEDSMGGRTDTIEKSRV